MIYIVCPDTVTGGTECLHQLGLGIKKSNFNVKIFYHDEGIEKKSRNAFKRFNIDIAEEIDDIPENLIIFPENITNFSKKFNRAKKAIFWLSVDNFFPLKGISPIRDFIGKYNLRRKRLFIFQIKDFIHLSQSYYSTTFLKNYNFKSNLIGDYLNDEFFSEAKKLINQNESKLNQVCFNPAKGKKYIDYLKSEFPEIKFIPIVNMTRHEVMQTLTKSKLYIDLGFHPGKDRIPREAAIMGACIATSRLGSAKNQIDVPIPDNYKFDLDKKSLNEIPHLVERVYNHFEAETKKFDSYREKIRDEKGEFYKNISTWLNELNNFN